MEGKDRLKKSYQICIGIVIGLLIYGLYFLTFTFINTIFGVILMIILPIAVIFSGVKLIRGNTYKVIGITLISVTGPIVLFSLMAGACFSIFAIQG